MMNTNSKMQELLPSHDVKYQDITYYKWDRNESVCSKDHIHADFLKAMAEMEKLDWTFSHNHIGFVNNRTGGCVQFVRLAEDLWYAENLINHGKNWDGYFWKTEADSNKVSDMMRLFFEEVPWFGMLNWKLGRSRF
jgi:hypothetical protein